MDNGLIFPYPYGIASAETGTAKAVTLAFGQGDLPNHACGRQADGETQEGSCTGRWSSRGKGVGLLVGKSASFVPET